MERFGITTGGQLLELCRFAGIGVVLGVVYDLFRLIRLLTKPPARRIFLQDLLYFALAAALTQVLALPVSHGRVRVFHLLALAVGATAYYLTVGRLVYWLAQHLVVGIEAVLQKISARLPRPTGKYRKKVKKTAKKVWNFFKNRLQPPHNI
ncbi:MAG: spore cortex biosynthesis protein YabQ [Clostridia bacterium]|nr:spore cortex biosynthesis protein YabQ [Clostridia bacterium]